jgi:hypothetical protein
VALSQAHRLSLQFDSESSSLAKADSHHLRIFEKPRVPIFQVSDMEAVLKQGNTISPRRDQPHRRAIGRPLLPRSRRPRIRLDGLVETISKRFGIRLRIPKIDYSAWGYSLRTACAACLALYISFSLNLDESSWAFTTCYIVGGQRLQGKILAKSLARVVGTLVGAIASSRWIPRIGG